MTASGPPIAALLGGTVGLMLACWPGRGRGVALLAFLVAAAVGALVPVPMGSTIGGALTAAGLLAAGVAALMAIWPPRAGPSVVLIAPVALAGLLAGLLAGTVTGPGILLPATALIAVPSRIIAAQGLPIVLRVVASWLLALAVLEATLALAPITPGNVQDHLE